MFHDDAPFSRIKLEKLLDITPTNNKEKIVIKKVIHKADEADKGKENINKNEIYKDIESLIKCFSIERASQYDMWLNAMFMIANELKEDGEDLFIEFSKKSPNFSEYDCRQFYEKYLDSEFNHKKVVIISDISNKSAQSWSNLGSQINKSG
jgi:hypothetical protein